MQSVGKQQLQKRAVSKIFTKKQCELLDVLVQSKEVMSSEQISDRLGLSARTVRRYIELINPCLEQYNAEIVSMRGYGFVMQGDIVAVKELLTGLSAVDYDRRIKDITVYLLSVEYITVEEISQALFYSVSALNKLISEVKIYLMSYQLKLKAKPHYGLSITGSETNIRNLMINCGFTQNYYQEISCFLKNISTGDFASIKRTIITFLQRHKIIIADDDVSDLIMRTTVIVSRCRQNRLLNKEEAVEENNLIRLLMEKVSVKCGVSIPLSEVSYLSIYFDILNHRIDKEEFWAQEDIRELVNQFLEQMQQIYTNLVIQKTVRESLVLHLSLMLNRINHKHYIKNGLMHDIKANYILEMNYAITFAGMIEDYFKIKIPEDELGYLALYFALSSHTNQKVKRVIILCNYGMATSQLIKEQVRERFPQLEVVGVYPLYYLEVAMNQEIDLIISTVSIDQSRLKKPLVVIKQVLDNDSFSEIKKVIEEPEENILLRYFNPRAYFCLNASTKENALTEMAERMVSLKFFQPDTISLIYERETISSTDIGNLVAIPHAIIDNSMQSVIGIGILEKPVLWDKEKVQIIFMAGINKQDAEKNNIFRYLYRVIKDVSNVNHMITDKSFDSFRKLF